jgi:hypothetical protein
MSDSKIVVFDLDETMGYFTQICNIWDSINIFLIENCIDKPEPDQDFFNKLLDLFPEYLRPNIESILHYLIDKKITKKCKNIMIYTNNQRQRNWVFFIKKYFENKINNKIIDQIICAFKVNGKQVELCRTTHSKTHKDFIKCSKLPINTQICFIDDTYYPEMHTNEVYYIKIKPYVYRLNTNSIIDRLTKSDFLYTKLGDEKMNFIYFLKEQLEKINQNTRYKVKSMKEYELDKIITKEIMNHIELFFNNKEKCPLIHFELNKTKKNKNYKNKTLKNRNLN